MSTPSQEEESLFTSSDTVVTVVRIQAILRRPVRRVARAAENAAIRNGRVSGSVLPMATVPAATAAVVDLAVSIPQQEGRLHGLENSHEGCLILN